MSVEAIISAELPSAEIGDVITDFIAVAHRRPAHPALEHGGVTVTYGELEQRMSRLRSRFRAGARVGLFVEHRPAVVENLLAVLSADAAYCPIVADLPEGRRAALAAALGVDQLALLDEPVVLDTSSQLVQPHSRTIDHADLPAYLLCTSGSTGAPKPVVVSRGALTVTARALRSLFSLTPHDRVLQFASLGWDTCLEEIVPALVSGATLVFDEAAHTGSMTAFIRVLAERGITVIDLPTAFWHELVLHLHDTGEALPGCLRLVVIGGERVDPTRLRQWCGLPTEHIRLLNTYGCTETTMISHAVDLVGPGAQPLPAGDEVPLGRPLPHVLDDVGADGELLVAGPTLATGYLDLPAETDVSFPVSESDASMRRWFRTGDLVLRAADGLLYSRGRRDDQVKVSGVRVHPAEVEAHLNAHPDVLGAVVVGERLIGRTALAAYVVAARPVSGRELRRHLRGRLPAPFIPTKVTFVDALAHTATGKVDRAATQRAAADCR
jgi:amino acid adenylation domain-containing protein